MSLVTGGGMEGLLTLTVLFEDQLSLCEILIVLPSSPVLSSLRVDNPSKNDVATNVSDHVRVGRLQRENIKASVQEARERGKKGTHVS